MKYLPEHFHPSDLRASLSGKDVPEDIRQKMLGLHEENISLKEQYKTAQEKLTKAKTVRISSIVVSYTPSANPPSRSSSSSKTSCSRRSMRRASTQSLR